MSDHFFYWPECRLLITALLSEDSTGNAAAATMLANDDRSSSVVPSSRAGSGAFSELAVRSMLPVLHLAFHIGSRTLFLDHSQTTSIPGYINSLLAMTNSGKVKKSFKDAGKDRQSSAAVRKHTKKKSRPGPSSRVSSRRPHARHSRFPAQRTAADITARSAGKGRRKGRSLKKAISVFSAEIDDDEIEDDGIFAVCRVVGPLRAVLYAHH